MVNESKVHGNKCLREQGRGNKHAECRYHECRNKKVTLKVLEGSKYRDNGAVSYSAGSHCAGINGTGNNGDLSPHEIAWLDGVERASTGG